MKGRPIRTVLGIGALTSLLACSDSAGLIDPFPIPVRSDLGPVMVAASVGDGVPQPMVLDVLSPVSVVDTRESETPRRRFADLTLFAVDSDGSATVPRLRFGSRELFDLNPCNGSEACSVGSDDATATISGIIGNDLLTSYALRLDLGKGEMRFFPDSAGSREERGQACEAVFDSPFYGGGTLLIAGSEVGFGAWRPALDVCLNHETVQAQDEAGTDATFAFSTAVGPTLLTESAYGRYASGADVPALADLPPATLHLPSGPVAARRGSVEYMAIVGNVGEDSDNRGPCREVYANSMMREAGSCDEPAADCPCADDAKTCKAGAVIEQEGPLEILVVPDSTPLIQSLRDELRPDLAELDGLIGTSAMQRLRVEFDFPNNRILMRCQDVNGCATHAQVRSQAKLDELESCRDAEEARRAPLPDGGSVESPADPDAGL